MITRTAIFFITSYLLSSSSHAVDLLTTVAGTGIDSINVIATPLETNIGNPFGVELDAKGLLHICEVSNHRVFRLDLQNQQLTIVAGTGEKGYTGDGGLATNAQLNEPYEIRFARNGDMYFVEMQNHVVRKVDGKSGVISTIAGDGQQGFAGDGGPAKKARLNQPHSIVLNDSSLYIADIGNHRIRRVDLKSGKIESIAGTEEHRLPTDGSKAKRHPVLGPRALFLDGDLLWVALREGHSIWKLNLATDTWHHISGTGRKGYSGDGAEAKDATFNGPKGLALDKEKNIFVVDTENQAIRKIDSKSGIITTIAGSGPQARGFNGDHQEARKSWLNRPHGICVSEKGEVYIGDSENHRVRKR